MQIMLFEEGSTCSSVVEQGSHRLEKYLNIDRPPDKSGYWKIIFFITHPKRMLWVL